MKIGLILVAGSPKQNQCLWPSFHKTLNINANHNIDLIVVHRNFQFLPTIYNNFGQIYFENKIFPNGELEHKAFGAYRYYFNKYKDQYDIFGFISDDVIFKRMNWIKDVVEMLSIHEKLGWIGSQIFNGLNGEYPHESHCRAPIWFAKNNALKDIDWQFDSDHDGEMRIADQFLNAGYFGCQIGNKFDFAYDSLENGGCFEGDHIVSILEKQYGGNLKDLSLFNNDLFFDKLKNNQDDLIVESPFPHIGKRKVISQIQPFNGLLFDKSISLAEKYIKIKKYNTISLI